MRIAIHAFDGITMFHIATPLLVFGEVARLGLAQDWSTTAWSANARPVRTADGVLIDQLAGPEAMAGADLVIFPSWPDDFPAPNPELLDLIRTAHRQGTAVAGLCLGAFPVVRSGILDGRTAVTHWAGAERLAAVRPEVQLHPEALYIDHGDVLTSAGTASGLDACLHVVRTRLGSAAAVRLARHLVIAPHREGDQAQYIERPLVAPEGAGPIGETISWALANLDQPLSVDDLAAQANMSKRNFTRRFRETVGTTPAQWIRARRLDDARLLLETTTWPISRVAESSGFGNAVTFRQSFVAAYATTPTSYRLRFTGGD